MTRFVAARGHSRIGDDETVVVLPTAGWLDPVAARWTLPLHVWVFEREAGSLWRGLTVEGFADLLDLPKGSHRNPTFQQRARDFLVDDERRKSVVLNLGSGHRLRLGKTGANGHAEMEVELPADELPPSAGNPWMNVSVVLEPRDTRNLEGGVQLIGQRGLSVVSDIDDTIKISHVTDEAELMRRTFLEPFEAVPEMARAYRDWQGAGAVFHYVSSSPWQLAPALDAFMDEAGLPRGSLHLRHFRVEDDSFLGLLASSRKTKPPVIEGLLKAHPGRELILVGDSGEVDPEIYGEIARRHPGRIRHIHIRRVTPETRDSRRIQAAFAGLRDDQWSLFEEPSALKRP